MPQLFARSGSAFVVNAATAGTQGDGRAARLASGNLAAVWHDGFTNDVWVRLITPSGAFLTGDLAVNTTTVGRQDQPQVAALTGGGFVVVWVDASQTGGDTSGTAVRAQVFAADGSKVGGEILVNTVTDSSQDDPRVAGISGGGFVVTWEDYSPTAATPTQDIKGQVFSSTGAKVGGEFHVAANTAFDQNNGSVAAHGSGFVATWSSVGGSGDGDGMGAKARIFTSNGSASSQELLLNATTAGNQHAPVIAPAAGNLIALWVNGSLDNQQMVIRFFSASGTPVTSEMIVDSGSGFVASDITVLPGGDVVVTWSFSGDGLGTWVRLYSSIGEVNGPAFFVAGVYATDVVASGLYDFSFLSTGNDGAGSGVVAQKFIRTDTPTLSIADVAKVEGDSGTTNFVFTVSLSSAAPVGGVKFNIATANQSATTAGGDYLAKSLLNQTIAEGATSYSFTVVVNGDTAIEANETFLVNISSIQGATGGDTQAVGTITNDDPPPPVAVADGFSVAEKAALSGSLVANDTSPSGAALSVSAVNGTAASVGQAVTLASGAKVTVNPDGTFSYDQGAVFNYLTDGSRGGVATTAEDSFTYTLSGGNSATVTLTVTGVSTAGDTLVGTGSNDIFTVISLADQVVEQANGGVDEVRTAIGSRLDFTQMYVLPAFVEKLTGTSLTGQGVYGNSLDNQIVMGPGGDLVVLQDGGNDAVSGGGGDDFLYYGAAFGNGDSNDGGAGYDGLGLLGIYTIAFDADDLVSIEKLSVFSSGVPLSPNGYALVLHDANVAAGQQLMVVGLSLTASETLNFNGAAETDGSFNLRAGRAADTLVGGAKSDQIYGNLGADTLTGGGGKDYFEYLSAAESTAAARDTILDFTLGDRINLKGIDADGNAANGDSRFSWIGSGAFTGQAGQLRATQSNGGWLVEGDTNGDMTADLVISVQTSAGHNLVSTDFML